MCNKNTLELLNQIKSLQGDDFVRDIQLYIMDKYHGSIEGLGSDLAIYVEPHGGWLHIKNIKTHDSCLFWDNHKVTAIEFLAEIAGNNNGLRTGELYLTSLNLVCEYFGIGAHAKLITYEAA